MRHVFDDPLKVCASIGIDVWDGDLTSKGLLEIFRRNGGKL